MSCDNSRLRCWLRKIFTNGSLDLNSCSRDYAGGRCSNVSVALIAMDIRCFHGGGKWRSEVKTGSEDLSGAYIGLRWQKCQFRACVPL